MKPKPKSRASALLLATILLFAILTVIISLSSVTVMEMKMGQKGKTSVASFYDAESGVEWALNTVATGNGDIKSKFTPNSDGSITCPAGVGGAGCKVYFLKADGTAMTQAEINASSGAPTFADVRSVRSVGREGNDTQRAIEAAVAGSSSQSFALLQNRRSQGDIRSGETKADSGVRKADPAGRACPPDPACGRGLQVVFANGRRQRGGGAHGGIGATAFEKR